MDEVQDFAGHDFNFLRSITQCNCEILLVGDFFQHTFETSNDGPVNRGLYDNYAGYKRRFNAMGLIVDEETRRDSFRCSTTVCSFIREKLNISIFPVKERDSIVEFITDQEKAKQIIEDGEIIKLFYNNSHKYNCYSQNWGASKGINYYHDVCVVLNKETEKLFSNNSFPSMNPKTKNKFYVACSRANNNLYFISDRYTQEYKHE